MVGLLEVALPFGKDTWWGLEKRDNKKQYELSKNGAKKRTTYKIVKSFCRVAGFPLSGYRKPTLKATYGFFDVFTFSGDEEK